MLLLPNSKLSRKSHMIKFGNHFKTASLSFYILPRPVMSSGSLCLYPCCLSVMSSLSLFSVMSSLSLLSVMSSLSLFMSSLSLFSVMSSDRRESRHLFHIARKGTQFPAKELQISYILRTRATIPINSEKYSFYIERWGKFGIFFYKPPIVAEKYRRFSVTMPQIKANCPKAAIVTEIPGNFSVTMTRSTIFAPNQVKSHGNENLVSISTGLRGLIHAAGPFSGAF